VVDSDGYRPNVGIILSNQEGRVLWARRFGQDAWQFPQGGIRREETPEEAMYRELGEEIGLRRGDVDVLSCTQDWLRYRLPRKYIRHGRKPVCIGQKQIWYLLRLLSADDHVRLDASNHPEFDRWCWVDYWYPLKQVVHFKRWVYRHALEEFAPLLDMPAAPVGDGHAKSGVGFKAQR